MLVSLFRNQIQSLCLLRTILRKVLPMLILLTRRRTLLIQDLYVNIVEFVDTQLIVVIRSMAIHLATRLEIRIQIPQVILLQNIFDLIMLFSLHSIMQSGQISFQVLKLANVLNWWNPYLHNSKQPKQILLQQLLLSILQVFVPSLHHQLHPTCGLSIQVHLDTFLIVVICSKFGVKCVMYLLFFQLHIKYM